MVETSRRGFFTRLGLVVGTAAVPLAAKKSGVKVWKAGDTVTAEDLNANFAVVLRKELRGDS